MIAELRNALIQLSSLVGAESVVRHSVAAGEPCKPTLVGVCGDAAPPPTRPLLATAASSVQVVCADPPQHAKESARVNRNEAISQSISNGQKCIDAATFAAADVASAAITVSTTAGSHPFAASTPFPFKDVCVATGDVVTAESHCSPKRPPIVPIIPDSVALESLQRRDSSVQFDHHEQKHDYFADFVDLTEDDIRKVEALAFGAETAAVNASASANGGARGTKLVTHRTFGGADAVAGAGMPTVSTLLGGGSCRRDRGLREKYMQAARKPSKVQHVSLSPPQKVLSVTAEPLSSASEDSSIPSMRAGQSDLQPPLPPCLVTAPLETGSTSAFNQQRPSLVAGRITGHATANSSSSRVLRRPTFLVRPTPVAASTIRLSGADSRGDDADDASGSADGGGVSRHDVDDDAVDVVTITSCSRSATAFDSSLSHSPLPIVTCIARVDEAPSSLIHGAVGDNYDAEPADLRSIERSSPSRAPSALSPRLDDSQTTFGPYKAADDTAIAGAYDSNDVEEVCLVSTEPRVSLAQQVDLPGAVDRTTATQQSACCVGMRKGISSVTSGEAQRRERALPPSTSSSSSSARARKAPLVERSLREAQVKTPTLTASATFPKSMRKPRLLAAKRASKELGAESVAGKNNTFVGAVTSSASVAGGRSAPSPCAEVPVVSAVALLSASDDDAAMTSAKTIQKRRRMTTAPSSTHFSSSLQDLEEENLWKQMQTSSCAIGNDDDANGDMALVPLEKRETHGNVCDSRRYWPQLSINSVSDKENVKPHCDQRVAL